MNYWKSFAGVSIGLLCLYYSMRTNKVEDESTKEDEVKTKEDTKEEAIAKEAKEETIVNDTTVNEAKEEVTVDETKDETTAKQTIFERINELDTPITYDEVTYISEHEQRILDRVIRDVMEEKRREELEFLAYIVKNALAYC